MLLWDKIVEGLLMAYFQGYIYLDMNLEIFTDQSFYSLFLFYFYLLSKKKRGGKGILFYLYVPNSTHFCQNTLDTS